MSGCEAFSSALKELFDAFGIHDRNRASETGDYHSIDIIWLPAIWNQVTTKLRQVEALHQAA